MKDTETYNRIEDQGQELPLELFFLSSGLDNLVSVDSGQGRAPLGFVENPRLSRVLWHDDEEEEGEDNGNDTLNEEDLAL